MEKENDVWGTLTLLGGQYISAKRDVNLAKASVATRSSPSGTDDRVTANPFPGTQGAYPQAEVKVQPGMGGGVSFNVGWMLAAIIGGLILFAMVRR